MNQWLILVGACLVAISLLRLLIADSMILSTFIFLGVSAVFAGFSIQFVNRRKPVIKTLTNIRVGQDLKVSRKQLIPLSKLDGERDALTGLPDQKALAQTVEKAIEQTGQQWNQIVLIAFDVDRLKDINGCFGFDTGDAVLVEIAKRLDSLGADLTVRLSGDRFVTLFTRIDGLSSAEMIGGTCLDRIGSPIRPAGGQIVEISPSASAGIALFPDHGINFAELLQNAEMAVDTAKRSGGRRCCVFENAMIDSLKRRRAMEYDLKIAIEQNQLHLAFQPQIDLKTGIIFGAEALMRWQDPDRGAVPPGVFIPVAESTGLIQPLGAWLIKEACRCLSLWREQGLDLVLAINISTAQLRQNDLIESIAEALSEYRLSPGDIELELTESLFVDPAELMMRRTLDNLARMGVNLAIDDFGTGFSSLAYLKRLPVSKIKIDKSFITGIGNEPVDEALIRTIIDLGKTFDKTVLAEGVENDSQLRFLQEEGCHQAQGYFFARPLSFEACSAMALRQSRHGDRGGHAHWRSQRKAG